MEIERHRKGRVRWLFDRSSLSFCGTGELKKKKFVPILQNS